MAGDLVYQPHAGHGVVLMSVLRQAFRETLTQLVGMGAPAPALPQSQIGQLQLLHVSNGSTALPSTSIRHIKVEYSPPPVLDPCLHRIRLLRIIPRSHISKWITEVMKTTYLSSDKPMLDKVTPHEGVGFIMGLHMPCHTGRRAFWHSAVFQNNYLSHLAPITGDMWTLCPVVAAQHIVAIRLNWDIYPLPSSDSYTILHYVHVLYRNTKKDYMVYSQYPFSRCEGIWELSAHLPHWCQLCWDELTWCSHP